MKIKQINKLIINKYSRTLNYKENYFKNIMDEIVSFIKYFFFLSFQR